MKFGEHLLLTKFAKPSPRQTFPLYGTEEMKTAIDKGLKITDELTARQLQLILRKDSLMLSCPAQLLDTQEKKLDGCVHIPITANLLDILMVALYINITLASHLHLASAGIGIWRLCTTRWCFIIPHIVLYICMIKSWLRYS